MTWQLVCVIQDVLNRTYGLLHKGHSLLKDKGGGGSGILGGKIKDEDNQTNKIYGE